MKMIYDVWIQTRNQALKFIISFVYLYIFASGTAMSNIVHPTFIPLGHETLWHIEQNDTYDIHSFDIQLTKLQERNCAPQILKVRISN